MPTTHDLTTGGNEGLPTMSGLITVSAILDTVANPLGNGDTAQMIHVPAGTTVLAVTANVETVEGAAEDIDIGDDDDDDQYQSALSVNTLGPTVSDPTDAFAYKTANHINILANAALTACVVRVTAVMFKHDGA